MSEVTPIPDHLALEVRCSQNIVCVGDLHVGLESEFRSRGVNMPTQTPRMERELVSLSPGKDRLILLGDVKNKVPGSTPQEYAELPGSSFDAAALLGGGHRSGNHDTNIEEFSPRGDGPSLHRPAHR
jgi:metallophosphoesterase superfamily enzyme